ncbi:MAG: DHH family phosphoesterase [Butyrivibrio sp.]|nr:DHH family phosphoesterase [Butyrivibrio sp.]
MKLSELLAYDDITIQCHDNPDADALASGYALYLYLKAKDKKVRFIYSGNNRIQKSNLIIMIDELKIPIEYVEHEEEKVPLLITIDCQAGERNVSTLPSKKTAVIDHHQVSKKLPKMTEIRANIGSCSTIIWDMLMDEGVDIESLEPVYGRKLLGTALFYGLYTDTNSLSEISHPLDRDLRDSINYERAMINRLQNANISLDELKITGLAILGYEYYDSHRYVIVSADPCDPNILGVISDFVLTVDAVDVALVYYCKSNEIKFSVRSCVKEVRADELATKLSDSIGGGGGHVSKAGGTIRPDLLEKKYKSYRLANSQAHKNRVTEEIMRERMQHYFNSYDIIYSDKYKLDMSKMNMYRKKTLHVGYVRSTDVFPEGNIAQVRTLEGDVEVVIDDERYLMIGVDGEVYPITREHFDQRYQKENIAYSQEFEYSPSIRNSVTGVRKSLLPYAKACVSIGKVEIYAKKLRRGVKVFTKWEKEKYSSGEVGDYLVCRSTDLHDIYIIKEDIFEKIYEKNQ